MIGDMVGYRVLGDFVVKREWRCGRLEGVACFLRDEGEPSRRAGGCRGVMSARMRE